MAKRPQRQPRGEARGSEPASRTRLNGCSIIRGGARKPDARRRRVAPRKQGPGRMPGPSGGNRRRRYQPMSCSSLNVRSCGVTTLCVRSPLIAGSMSWFGNAIVSQCDTEAPTQAAQGSGWSGAASMKPVGARSREEVVPRLYDVRPRPTGSGRCRCCPGTSRCRALRNAEIGQHPSGTGQRADVVEALAQQHRAVDAFRPSASSAAGSSRFMANLP